MIGWKKKAEQLQEQLISMATELAELKEKVAEHDRMFVETDAHVQELFNDSVAEVAKQWSAGLDSVVSFDPLGTGRRYG